MKARVRERRAPEERRAQILDETIRLLGERGYHGFTIQELAGRCGITNGALLYYFRSKEDLLAVALREYDRREAAVIGAFARDLEPNGPEEGSLPAALKILQFLGIRIVAERELERLCLVLQSEALGDPAHPAHGFFREREKSILDGLEQLLKPHRDNAAELARELLAMIDGLTLRWMQADHGFEFVAAWDRAAAKLLGLGDCKRD